MLQATIIRRGFHEILSLSKALFPGVQDSTFLESCGIADLVASCYGGRNRRVAEAFVRAALSSKAESFEALEVRHPAIQVFVHRRAYNCCLCPEVKFL